MAVAIPENSPQTMGEAFGYINTVTAPTLDDLKVMVLLEAAGLELYRGMASKSENPAIVALLEHNGREELAHSHRVAKAILAISGETFVPPEASDNPYLDGPMLEVPLTAEGITGLAQGEFAGKDLYENWASNCTNEEAARLFRLNGKEEAEHGGRLLEVAAILQG